ncbi:hypothetical protein HF086_003052 [Spodoptera exigua]|uniref:Cuticular protein RR-2 n=1 Tax=Spodoptera exigua TaxID=7107 RepID=A0A922S8F7_SPOEX|nr:hypothetical protein HF086_003052 [Spodoptera exigua]
MVLDEYCCLCGKRALPLFLIVATVVAQYGEEFGGYEGYHKAPIQLHHQQSLDDHHGEEYDMDYHAHPKYSFDYSVKDPHTGDNKEHWETRDGDKVKGTYTLIETDGTKRVVEYEADDKNGFNAVVHKIGTPKHEEYEHKPVHEYEAKPALEPLHYQHDYGHFDEGFVPVAGGFDINKYNGTGI